MIYCDEKTNRKSLREQRPLPKQKQLFVRFPDHGNAHVATAFPLITIFIQWLLIKSPIG